MNKIIAYCVCLWLFLVGVSFYWNYSSALNKQQQVLQQTAKSFFLQIVLTRAWNAEHGGVYVPVTKDTLPNKYLKTPMRDIVVNGKLTLTKINPAYMTRQISEMAEKQNGVHFHITSLKPTRPGNEPSEIERLALSSFEKDEKEYSRLLSDGAEESFFYMAPLCTEKNCLQCHAEQGYKEGDIRGGISVTLPHGMELPVFALITGHLLIGLVGAGGLILGGSKLKKAYEMLRYQSVTDALTGIPNRRLFSETILRDANRCRRQKTPLSMVMCDIDYFKLYNDSFGHEKGDECLRTVAKAVETGLLRPGDFCARYGGEEFVIVLPETDRQGAGHVAERIRSAVAELKIPHPASREFGIVTLSLGVATLDADQPMDQEKLTKLADDALYRAKNLGRNRVEMDPPADPARNGGLPPGADRT